MPPPGRVPRIDRVERERFNRDGIAAAAAAEDARALRFVSCGPPLPGHELRVVDAGGQALPERHVGELEFRGPSATRGYHRNPVASADLFHGDWPRTGDRAYLADGEFHLIGRSKDLIIRGGRNFYPYDLERAIGELPGTRRGCVAAFGAGTRAVLPSDHWRARRGPLAVTVRAPVMPEGEQWQQVLTLRDRVRAAILMHCDEADATAAAAAEDGGAADRREEDGSEGAGSEGDGLV